MLVQLATTIDDRFGSAQSHGRRLSIVLELFEQHQIAFVSVTQQFNSCCKPMTSPFASGSSIGTPAYIPPEQLRGALAEMGKLRPCQERRRPRSNWLTDALQKLSAAHEWISVLRSSGRTLFPFPLWVNWDEAVKNILTRHENAGPAKLSSLMPRSKLRSSFIVGSGPLAFRPISDIPWIDMPGNPPSVLS
jgi:hypothetical protein